MAFCPKCGKQLADGEICSCQTVQPQQQAPVQPQAPVQQKAPAQTPEFIKAILELFKGLFKKPADAVKNFVLKSPILSPVLLLAALSLISAIGELIRMIGVNASNVPNSLSAMLYYEPVYSLLEMVGGFLGQILYMFAATALSAVVIMGVVNALEKNKKVTYTQAFAVAAIGYLFTVPFSLVGTLIGIIPATFFGYVKSWFVSAGSALGLVSTIIGLRAIEEDDNHMPLVYVIVAVVTVVLGTLLNAVGL